MAIRTALAISLAALSVTTPAVAQPAMAKVDVAPARHQITAIHAYAWEHGTGIVRGDDLAVATARPFNWPLDGDSVSLLVVVELTGPSWMSTPGRLTVEARVGGHRAARQVFRLDRYHVDGERLAMPLIVTEVGCDPVVITATLAGHGLRGTATNEVAFGCGE